MRRYFGIVLFGAMWAALFIVNASARQGGATPNAPTGPAAVDVAILFAPLLAASTSIERLLEMFWNWFEALFTNFIAFVAMGWEWTHWARSEIETANQAINDLALQLAQLRGAPTRPSQPAEEAALLQKMRLAEERLAIARDRLRGVLKSERYRSIKQALSVLAGVALGLLVSAAANLKMFDTLGITGVPPSIDIVVTGLIIGTGSGPVHSLVGLLQQGKETVEQTSALLRGRSQLTQSELTARAGGSSNRNQPTS